jgi:trehalose synthase
MATQAVADRLVGHTLWHVNSTASGGGVAELLSQLLGYLVEVGIQTRWLVVEGDQAFFSTTKRIHNRLHGSSGDGGSLGAQERVIYRSAMDHELPGLLDLCQEGDVVVLHDPQTVGLVGPLIDAGIIVVWVCHVGLDTPNDLVRSAWDFLRPDVERADALVFSRSAYVWTGLERRRVHIIPPCIDPTSAKNTDLSPGDVSAVLAATRIVSPVAATGDVKVSLDGTDVVIRHPADLIEEHATPVGAPIVMQLSRWDRLKDHVGVLQGFSEHVQMDLDAHLLLVGPDATGVVDDPEGAAVLAEVVDAWRASPRAARDRIHIISLPVEDQVENAIVVNALQRRADVVVQKSLAEGFGLTVSEAMWKERPVVGARVGGIQDQIRDGRSGLLVDPADLEAMGHAISSLVADAGFANAIGHAARQRVRKHFLPPRFLAAHLEVVLGILERVPV